MRKHSLDGEQKEMPKESKIKKEKPIPKKEQKRRRGGRSIKRVELSLTIQNNLEKRIDYSAQ